MGHQIIKQPNGLYALFSSIVDDFILIDATPQDIIREWVDQYEEEITRKVITIVRDLNEDKKPYYQFTMTFKEAVETIKERHGEEAESLKFFEENRGS